MPRSEPSANLSTHPFGRVKNAAPDRFLLYKDYESGLNNELMSVELAVGLAHLTGRRLVFYGHGGNDKELWYCRGGHFHEVPESRRHVIDNQRHPTVMDILEELPVETVAYPDFRKTLMREQLEIVHSTVKLDDAVFVAGELPQAGTAAARTLEWFAEGREVFGDAEEAVLHIDQFNLGYYSRLFFAPEPELYALMEEVRPKRVYRELAKRIAEALGVFVGAHIRLTDFRNFLPQDEEAYPGRILESLRANFEPEKLLVISTDESENKAFFKDILEAFPKHVFLDEFIVEHFAKDFKELPFTDETAMGLICNLVMYEAEDFVGTQGSSFSGMIHRNVLRAKVKRAGAAPLPAKERTFKYINSGFPEATILFEGGVHTETAAGPYSWNRIELPFERNTKSWIREWPESVVPGGEAATVEFPMANDAGAAEAELLRLCMRCRFGPEISGRVRLLVHQGIDWDKLVRLVEGCGSKDLLVRSLEMSCPEFVPAPLMKRLRKGCQPRGQRLVRNEIGKPETETKRVWLASYPRSGNTLLRTLLMQCFGLRSTSVYPNDVKKRLAPKRNDSLEKSIGHIEHDVDGEVRFPAGQPALVKTHERPADEGPAIYVVRDGRAASVSLAAFEMGRRSLAQIIEGRNPYGTWSSHLQSWNPWERPNTLLLRYEDMVADPTETLRQLSEFLKREIVNTEIPDREVIAEDGGLWVKKKDGWKGEISEELMERFNEINGEMMEKAGYL